MKVDLKNFETIIFDFGGVILDINPELSINAFKKYGSSENYQKIEESGILWEFERGEISRKELQARINAIMGTKISSSEFEMAWNAMLLNYKKERILKIKELAKTHKLLMLSNTNEIHYTNFSNKLKKEFSLTFHDLFSEVYLSHKMGLIKPNKAIYEQVIKEQNLLPDKTLFIEDTAANAEAASELGIQTLVIPRNGSFYNSFK